MKTLFVTLCLFCITAHGSEIQEELKRYSTPAISKWISQEFIINLEKQMGTDGLLKYKYTEDPRVSIIPPFDDPLYWNTWELPLNLNLEGFANLYGDLSFCFPRLVGLSNLTDHLGISFLPDGGMFIGWEVELPALEIQSPYQVDLGLNSSLLGVHNVNGEGKFLAGVGSMDNSVFKLKANASIFNQKMTLDTLWFDLSLEKLSVSAEDLVVDGFKIELELLARAIKFIFGLVWNDRTRPVITEQIRCAINHAISSCTRKLIESNFECLNMTWNPDCFGNGTDFQLYRKERKFRVREVGYCDIFSKPTTTTTTAEFTTTETSVTSGTVGITLQRSALLLAIVATIYVVHA